MLYFKSGELFNRHLFKSSILLANKYPYIASLIAPINGDYIIKINAGKSLLMPVNARIGVWINAGLLPSKITCHCRARNKLYYLFLCCSFTKFLSSRLKSINLLFTR